MVYKNHGNEKATGKETYSKHTQNIYESKENKFPRQSLKRFTFRIKSSDSHIFLVRSFSYRKLI